MKCFVFGGVLVGFGWLRMDTGTVRFTEAS